MSDKPTELLGYVVAAPFVIVLAVAIVFAQMVIEGWVSLSLWRWFAEPLGAPAVTLWHIAGINLLITTFVWRFIPTEKDQTLRRLGEWALMCATCYSAGWALSHWV